MKVLIVEALYHAHIANALADGATRELEKGGASFERISVPGALEIPPAIAIAAKSARPYDGYVALGSVLRDSGNHFDLIAGQSAHGLMLLAAGHGLCIGNGIIAADNEDAALDMAYDAGGDAARACLSLLTLHARLGIFS